MPAEMREAFPLPNSEAMEEHADEVTRLLSALANRNRLMILCALLEGEHSVGALNEKVPLSQSALSQHLARLRREGIVRTRREAQTIYYRIEDPAVLNLMKTLYDLYCAPA